MLKLNQLKQKIKELRDRKKNKEKLGGNEVKAILPEKCMKAVRNKYKGWKKNHQVTETGKGASWAAKV